MPKWNVYASQTAEGGQRGPCRQAERQTDWWRQLATRERGLPGEADLGSGPSRTAHKALHTTLKEPHWASVSTRKTLQRDFCDGAPTALARSAGPTPPVCAPLSGPWISHELSNHRTSLTCPLCNFLHSFPEAPSACQLQITCQLSCVGAAIIYLSIYLFYFKFNH